MDLINLTPKSDEIVVEVKHPVTEEVLLNDDGSKMTITLYAPYSKEHKKVVHDIANKRIKKAKNNKSIEFSMEELEEATLDTLVRTTKEWNITYDGNSPKLTQEKVKEVYEKVFWIKPQLEVALNSTMDFMTA